MGTCSGGGSFTLPDLNPTTLQNCFNSINADGTTIVLPAGTATWTTSVSYNQTNSFTLQGAGAISATTGGASTTGTDQTIIINHVPGSTNALSITTIAGKSLRITGIAFLEDSGTPGSRTNVNIWGNATSVRVDHCHFFLFVGGSKGLGFLNSVTGVADHIYVNTTQLITNDFVFENGATWNGDTGDFGNKSWADGDHWGTSQFAFVEDTRIDGGYASDCGRAGRYVFRYSTLVNQHGFEEHGTHDQYRGCRASEAYHNTVTSAGSDSGGILHSNSGTSLVWGNTITSFSNAIDLAYYRQANNNPYPLAAVPNGFGACGPVSGLGPSVWDQNSVSNGYACLDSPARGQGDLLTNFVSSFTDVLNSTTGTRTWPHQARSPVYTWLNVMGGGGTNNVIGNGVASLTENVDYYRQFGTFGNSGTFNGTVGVGSGLLAARPATCTAGPGGNTPGVAYWATDVTNPQDANHPGVLYACTATNTWTVYYTPFVYPHPLQGGGMPSQCSGGGSHTLADLQPTTLQTCLNSIDTDNTTVILPAGSITWTTAVSATLNNSVIIQGAGAISSTTGGTSTTGTDQTTILDHVNHGGGGSNQSLGLSTIAGKSLRITGIAFVQDATSQSANNGIIAIGGNSTSVRLDHCHFNMVIFSHELNLTGIYGVADHNYFQGAGGVGGLYFEYGGTDGLGDDAWNQADQWGTANFFYVEDNLFDDHGNTDSHAGARYVFRHNNTIARQSHTPSMANHGIHDRARASRAIEVYQNTWTSVLGSGNGGPTTSNNGGAEIYWGNTINGYQRAFDIDYTCKDTSTYGECGTNPPNGWGLCNTTTGNGWDQNASPPNGYACIDGPGRGQGDQISGSFPTVCNLTLNPGCNIFTGQWPRQAISPIYLWMNNYTPASGFGTVTFLGNSGVVNNNRDYYMQFGPNGANPGSFTGATGTGFGLLSARPATCTAGLGGNTTGVGYFATDVGTQGTFYTCNPTNTWTVYYTPFTYPHPLQGGSAPSLGFSPSPAGFGNQVVGTSSSALTITVSNTGTASETLSTPYFTITGTNAGDFANAGTGTCANGGTIAVSGSCTANLTFTPSATGARSAVFTVNGTASGTDNLTGTGVQAALSFSPNPAAFGNQTVNTTSSALTVTVTNTGTSTETLNTPYYTITGTNASEFANTGTGTCANAGTIAANASCTVILTFTPTAAGARTATLNVQGTVSAGDNLTGTGVSGVQPPRAFQVLFL